MPHARWPSRSKADGRLCATASGRSDSAAHPPPAIAHRAKRNSRRRHNQPAVPGRRGRAWVGVAYTRVAMPNSVGGGAPGALVESREVTRESRFVFTAEGDVRLMAKAADPARAMRFEFADDAGIVLVRDQLEDRGGIPYHAGLELQVATEGSVLDGRTFEQARAAAETVLMLLSGASRAPTRDVEARLAYELPVAGKASALKQWFDASEIPSTPVPVPVAALGALWHAINETAVDQPELAQRVIISMSWYRRALREVEDLYRFQQLWLAFEAIEPRLAEAYDVPPSERAGFQGLRRLANEDGGGSELVSAALGVRRDLFHTRRVLPDDMRADKPGACST
jgi:hypothetical protein